jgi:hypothetical protein
MRSYFAWATQSRAGLVEKLAPHYKLLCRDLDKGGLFTTPKTQCEVFKGEASISKTRVMNWPGKTEKDETGGYSTETVKAALDFFYKLPAQRNDWRNWSNVNRKSGEQIERAADCMDWMYRAASNTNCPALLDRTQLQLQNTSTLQYSWTGSTNWRRQRRFNP